MPGIGEVINAMLEHAQPAVPEKWMPGIQPTEQELRNEYAAKLIASGVEPISSPTMYGERLVLPAEVTGAAPLLRSITGDWREAQHVDGPDGKPVLALAKREAVK